MDNTDSFDKDNITRNEIEISEKSEKNQQLMDEAISAEDPIEALERLHHSFIQANITKDSPISDHVNDIDQVLIQLRFFLRKVKKQRNNGIEF